MTPRTRAEQRPSLLLPPAAEHAATGWRRRDGVVVGALVVLAAAALAASATVQTTRYAVYHDELWNHPAAVSLLQGRSWRSAWEISVLGVPVPLVSGPYQGSVKTLVLAPLLATFGTSPGVLRGIHCGLGILYLAALFWALRAVFSRRTAAVVFLLPLADPNLTMFVPTDQGPFLLQNTFFAVAIGAMLRFAQGREFRWLLKVLAAASLALADKLTGVPLAAVLMACALALGVRVLGRSVKRWALAGLVVVVPLLPHAAYFARAGFAELKANVGSGMAQRSPYPARLRDTVTQLTGFIADGSAIPKSLTSQSPPTHRPLLAPLALVLVAIGGARALRRSQGSQTAEGLAALCFVLGVASFAAVPGLDRPWHYSVLHPPLVVAAFLGFRALVSWAGSGRPTALAVRTIAGLSVAGAALVGTARTGELISFLATRQGAHMYSPGLYQVHQHLRSREPQRIICLNYSLCNPLYVLSGGSVEPVDLTWAELSDATEQHARYLLSLPGTVVVYRHVSGAAGPAQEGYFTWLNRTSDWLLPRFQDFPELARVAVHADERTEFGLVFPAPASATPFPTNP